MSSTTASEMSRRRTGSSVPTSATCPNSERLLRWRCFRPSAASRPPIKGVYRGAADAELDASVTMTRLDPQASARA
jgi:hypothetical protein